MSGNLPDGVTQGMIDRHFAGPCEDCAEGFHEACEDDECSCPVCEEWAREDFEEALFEARREARRAGE